MSPLKNPTYWEYLRLDQLLALQGGVEGDESALRPDELHFILVHQTMELWFKLVLAELRLATEHLGASHLPEERVPYVVHHLRRVSEILALCVRQFQVVETLTPQDFLAFRDKLVPASGFQSYQMRELEILLGLEDAERARLGQTTAVSYLEELAARTPGGAPVLARLGKARREQTLKTALDLWLFRTPIQGSTPDQPGDDEVVRRFLNGYLAASRAHGERQLAHMIEAAAAPPAALRARFEATASATARFLLAEGLPEPTAPEEARRVRRVRAALVFIESYRTLPLLAWPRTLLDTIVSVEQQLLLFRSRHARMVERLIGRRVGTGGSDGVGYLDATGQYRIFKDLWEVRTVLLHTEALPELEHPEVYGFAL